MTPSAPAMPRWPNSVAASLAHLFAYFLDRPVPGPSETFEALGGDDVKAAALQETIKTTFKVALPDDVFKDLNFSAESLAALLIAAKSANTPVSAPSVSNVQDRVPALPAQGGLYSVDRITRGEARPVLAGALVIEGTFDRAALEAALATAMQRHDCLRLRFETHEQQVMIRAEKTGPVIEDFAASASSDVDLIRSAAAKAALELDLDKGQGVRWLLCEQSPDRTVLIMVAHHAVLDAVSRALLFREIGEIYLAGGSLNSLPLAPSFMGVAAERAAAAAGSKAETDEAYWRRCLTPLPGDLNMPSLIGDGDGAEFERRVASYPLDDDAVARLVTVASRESATPFIAFARIMARCFASEQDGIVSVPVSNRDRPGRQNIVGCLMQTLPLQLSGKDGAPYQRMQEEVSQMLSHATLSVEELTLRGVLKRKGLFEAPIATQFQFRREEPEVIVDRSDLRIRRLEPVLGINNLLPLSIDIKRGARTVIHCDYDPGLVDPAGLDIMIERINAALSA